MSDTTTVAPPAKPAMTVDQMVDRFVRLRDKVAKIKKEHTAELEPFNAAMDTLEGLLIGVLNTNSVTSMRSEHGTIYTSSRVTAKVVRWSQALEYIQQNEAWELLDARVSKVAAEAIITESGQPIPGVEMTRETTLNVRRS